MERSFLGIYLRDHHAASAAGVALVRSALGPSHPLTEQVAGDRKTLENIMRQLEVKPSGAKVAFARAAELVGRLKLNGSLLKRSPLSGVVELETLLCGIRGKQALWAALQTADLTFQDIDLQALVESARTQAEEVDQIRLRAAANSFSGEPPSKGGSEKRRGQDLRRKEQAHGD